MRRSTTRAACAALGLEPWEDPHNADPSFRGVRVRQEVLPLLEDVLAGGVAEALARTAQLLQDDLDALDAEATRITLAGRPRPWRVSCELERLPRAVRTRVLRSWARGAGAAPLSAERTAALDALVVDWHGQGPIQLPGGVSVRRTSGRLGRIRAAPPSTRREA